MRSRPGGSSRHLGQDRPPAAHGSSHPSLSPATSRLSVSGVRPRPVRGTAGLHSTLHKGSNEMQRLLAGLCVLSLAAIATGQDKPPAAAKGSKVTAEFKKLEAEFMGKI